MKKIIFLIGFIMPLCFIAEGQGIHFEQGITWEQITAKAKAERKFIFVDCYATWCGPCKVMDKEVYPDDTVGNFINSKFISVKVQMDSTKMDNMAIQILYPAAREFEKQYKIVGLPSFLFFSPEGEAVDKKMGVQTKNEFIQIAKNAINPEMQAYSLVKQAHEGKMSANRMISLATSLKDKMESELAVQVARDYMLQYLEKLSDADFTQKSNMEFFKKFGTKIFNSHDRIFKLYYEKPEKVNAIMGDKNYSRTRVNLVITREEIQPYVDQSKKQGGTLQWKTMYQTIKDKYGKNYAEENILESKMNLAWNEKNLKQYLELLNEKRKKYGDTILNNYDLNGIAWEIAMKSDKKKMLEEALFLSTLDVEKDNSMSTARLDTKATILYMLGNKDEAVQIEGKIIEMLTEDLKNARTDQDRKNRLRYINSVENIKAKMQIGESIVYKNGDSIVFNKANKTPNRN